MALYTQNISQQEKKWLSSRLLRESIRVELDGEGAPIHVGNFVELAAEGLLR